MQERPDESDLSAQPGFPGGPIPGEAPTAANPQPYLNEPPAPPTAPPAPAHGQPVLNPQAYYNHGAVSGPPEQPVPPLGRTHGEFTNDQEYIASTPYPYEPARNDPNAALDRPPAQYTPNMEATAAASQQMHSYAYEQEHTGERGSLANAWVRLTSLLGRPLLDLENGRKLGRVENLVLTRDHRFVAGFVAQDASVAVPPVYPARGATIGEDAVVLPAASLQEFSPESFRGMPLARRLLGMAIVTAGGKIVGKVTDVRFDPQSHEVFLQVEDEGNLLQRLLRQSTIVPATAIHTYGQDVLVVGEAAARQYLSDKL
jgi:sporulation protein YlmC with PRC-barrel domain